MSTQMMNVQFKIGEVAKFFFDQNTIWLRYNARAFQGARCQNRKWGGGDRVYTLSEVMDVAKLLYREGLLDAQAVEVIQRRVDAMSVPVRYIPTRPRTRSHAERDPVGATDDA